MLILFFKIKYFIHALEAHLGILPTAKKFNELGDRTI